MILQKEILALLCLLALFENRASYQSEAVDVQSGLCSGLTEEKDQQTLLFVSDIVFFGRILQSYRGTVGGTLVAKVRYFFPYKGELPLKPYIHRYIFVENFSDGSHSCLPSAESHQLLLFYVSIVSGRFIVSGVAGIEKVPLKDLNKIERVAAEENERIGKFVPPAVNPCHSPSTHNCSEKATCDVMNPWPTLNYRCVCNLGYFGDGFACEAVAMVTNKSDNTSNLPELPKEFFSKSTPVQPSSSVQLSSSIQPSSTVQMLSSVVPSSSVEPTSSVEPSSSGEPSSSVEPTANIVC
jgi:hypothetical protein